MYIEVCHGPMVTRLSCSALKSYWSLDLCGGGILGLYMGSVTTQDLEDFE